MSAVKNVIKDNYNMMLLKDFLRIEIKDSGFSHAEISKTPTGTKIALHVTRPGIVIGRKGTGIRQLTEDLATKFGLKNPQISVVEIKKPELSASVMCNRMSSLIERGTMFRRATMWTLQLIMENGAMGVQITISGKLRGDRSAFEKHTAGVLPRAGNHAKDIVDEDVVHVKTAMGLIGIRIRIALKEKVIPEFEFKKTGEVKTKSKVVEKPAVEESKKVEEKATKPEPKKVEEKAAVEESVEEKAAVEESVEEKAAVEESVEEKAAVEEGEIKSETDQVEADKKKIDKLDSMEEEEEELK